MRRGCCRLNQDGRTMRPSFYFTQAVLSLIYAMIWKWLKLVLPE